MKIFTIGFTGKSAEVFFKLLVNNDIRRLIDIRLNNKSQLAGFANVKHLPYFLKLHNIEYLHCPECAPTKELLNDYKKKKVSWNEYETIYLKLLEDRQVIQELKSDIINNAVFLCSEIKAEKCHRRLLVESIARNYKGIEICHL